MKTKQIELIATPKQWGTKNPQVNQLMRQKAKSLLKNISKSQKLYLEDKKSYTDILFCFEKFFKSFLVSLEENKMIKKEDVDDMKTVALSFAHNVAKEYTLDLNIIDNIWNYIKK